MAKIRRIIRKLETPLDATFDEQSWPVNVALVILGAFSLGTSLAYQRFDDPRIIANAWTYVIGIPLFVGTAIAVVNLAKSRAVRRSMQLAAVLSGIVHLGLLILSAETMIFAQLEIATKTKNDLTDRRAPTKAQHYKPTLAVPQEERQQHDFEKPVETETPETEQEKIIDRTHEPENVSPRTIQPIPIQETVRTLTPNVTKQEGGENSQPREADTTAKLSRQTQVREMTLPSPSAQTATEKPKENKPEPTSQAVKAVKSETSASAVKEQTAEATPVKPDAQAAARRAEQDIPKPETTAQATLPRQINQPAVTPKSQIDLGDAASPTKRNSETEPTPANTAKIQRSTAGPVMERPERDPTPEMALQPTPRTRRESEAKADTAVAQAATPTKSTQPRVTPRAETTASAPQSPAASNPAQEISLPGPQSTAVARAAPPTVNERAAPTQAAAPNSPNDTSKAAARVARTETAVKPNDPTIGAAANVPSRTSGNPGQTAAKITKVEAVAAAQSENKTGELNARSTEARKAEVESAAVANAAGRPTPESTPAASPTAVATNTPSRAAGQSNAPSPTPTPVKNAVAGKANNPTAVNVVTRAATVETTSGPNTSQSLEASASTSLVSRQNSAQSAAAAQTQPNLAVPSNIGAGAISGGGLAKAQPTASPSINPAAAASNTPQRADRVAQAAVSPQNVENPAASAGNAGSAEPTAQAAKLALNRSQSGTAGTGNSPNLDRGTAAPDSPAMTASISARRDAATSAGPADAALTPSTVAVRAHSRAANDLPTASVQAEAVVGGNQGGAMQLAELAASSSAATTRAAANAAPGDISAAKGTGEIDVGPTQLVSEGGQSRAAGGGQPEVSLDPQTAALARQTSGGAVQPAIASTAVANVPAAPSAEGGGTAASLDPSSTLAIRGDGTKGQAGGPSKSEEKGPLTEPTAAVAVAQAPSSRADASQGGTPEIGGAPDLEDEEEKARRLARLAAGGAPQIAVASTKVADVPVTPQGDSGGGGAIAVGSTGPVNTAATRSAQTGGLAAGGNLPAIGDESPAVNGTGAPAVPRMRAEIAAAAESPVATIGGGTEKPSRSSGGRTIATASQAEMIELAGAPQSGGAENGTILQAQGVVAARTGAGAPTQITEGAIGAAAGPATVDSVAGTNAGAVASGKRNSGTGSADGPAVASFTPGGAPNRVATTAGYTGNVQKIDLPQAGTEQAVVQAELDHGMARTALARNGAGTGSGLVIQIEAPEGAGGIGLSPAAQVGLTSRAARPDSMEFTPQAGRFVDRNQSRGLPAVSIAAVVPADSFKQRAEGRKGTGVRLPPQTETAIEMGLQFLSRYQQADGSWRLQGMEGNAEADPQMVSDTAATALALLAFQGAGYNHREHKYAAVVRNGLDYLIRNQKETGDLFVPLDDSSNKSVWLYSHALASLALCEAYGMSQDPDLLEPAQKAVDFIVKAQHKERGGWRYSPGIGSDTSVTGAMLVTLRSAELAGLKVPEETFAKVRTWLDHAQASESQPHLYRYNPHAPDTIEQRHGRQTSPTMTSLGLLMRLYLGWRRDNPNMENGAEYLKLNPPAIGTSADPLRDTYYWYYATQVMYHMGGDHWKQWHAELHKLLSETQVKEGPQSGSWHPRLPVADRWGPHGGRLFVTTMNLLSLEVQYRYLPTYEDTAK